MQYHPFLSITTQIHIVSQTRHPYASNSFSTGSYTLRVFENQLFFALILVLVLIFIHTLCGRYIKSRCLVHPKVTVAHEVER